MLNIFVFVLGLIFGSFANVVIYRLPKGKSVVKPASACPTCGKQLKLYNMTPLISWLLLRGKCCFCKEKISFRYFLVELSCGVLFTLMLIHTPTLAVIPLWIFAFILLVIFFIDIDTQEIPDVLLIIAGVGGVAWVGLGQILWVNALLGVFAGTLPLLIIDKLCLLFTKKDGFGYGDVKLMAVAGIFLGWQLVLVAFFFAFISGGAISAALLARGKINRGAYIAFAPFLCFGILYAFLFGEHFIAFFI